MTLAKLVLPALIALPFACSTPAGSDEPALLWNQFRGPNGSGVAKNCQPPVKLGTENVAWKVPVAPGLSSPVLSHDRIFLTAIEGERLVTLAFEKQSGRIAWRKEAPKVKVEKVHKTSSPAAPTPLVDMDHVYAYFGSYGLICYTHDGDEVWKKPIPTPRSLYGMSTSPIAYKNLLIQVLDNEAKLPGSQLSQSKILALRKSDGKVQWERDRPFHRSGNSTPMIWTHGEGKERENEVVVLGNKSVRGYDADTGEEKWSVGGFSRETIAVPVAGNGHLYVSSAQLGGVPDEKIDPKPFWDSLLQYDKNGDQKIERQEMTGHFTFPLRPELPLGHPGYGIPLPENEVEREKRRDGILNWVDKNRDGFWTKEEFEANLSSRNNRPVLAAIRPGGKGDITGTHVSWRVKSSIPEVPSPVFHDNRIYLVRNGGLFSAVDTTKGKMLYRERLGGSGYYSASPVVANGHVYTVSDQGLVSVLKAGGEFQVVHELKLGEMTFVSPAVDRDTVYFRTDKHLIAYRRKG